MSSRFITLLLGLLLFAPLVATAQDTDLPSPDRGLEARSARAEFRISDRFIFVRDERMRQTHFTLVVHAGCLEEEPDCRGIAHYLEHLILVGRNAEHTESAFRFFSDGFTNGWTNQKATAFIHRIPLRREQDGSTMRDLERLLAFYANRLKSFEVSPADAVRERDVVMQEYQLRTGNTPFGRFGVEFDRLLFPTHPLGQRVIGSPETIEAFTLEEARRFHARWYAPNNVTVVVAGNLDPEAVRAAAARTFGALEARPLPARSGRETPRVEPEHRTLRVEDAQVTRRSVRYAKLVRISEETERSRGAQLLLSTFLASQLAGSPHDVLVEQKGLTDGMAAGISRYLPGLYQVWLSAEPTPETSPEQLAEALRGYLGDLVRRGGPGSATLERLQRRYAADLVATSWSGERMMGRVVDWVAGGDPYDALAAFPVQVAATTGDDITRLLRELTGLGREVTGFLLPSPRQQGRAQ